MKKHIAMNFSNPNARDGEKPYRVHCDFKLTGKIVVDVYKCPILAKMQATNINNRVVHHSNNEVFVFQNTDDTNQLFDKTVFGNMCKICPNKHRGGR